MNKEFCTPRGPLVNILQDIVKHQPKGGQVLGGWSEIVGEKCAEHSRIVDIESGCLKIAVRDAATKQYLMLRKREILAKLSKKYAGCYYHDINIVIEKAPQSTSTTPQEINPTVETTNEQDAQFQQLLDKIKKLG